jgi:ubiquinone/menaquinone biosynthesis C-methylase UbiE
MGYYDSIAKGYEELHRQEQEDKLKIIQQELPFSVSPDMKLLDVGCGSGISMEPWNCGVFGVDPSTELLKIATEKGLHVKQGDASNIPYDGPFDIVLSITALHHVDYPDDAAKEIARVCNSWLILSYLKKANIMHREAVLDALGEYFKKEKVIEQDKDVIYFFSKR